MRDEELISKVHALVGNMNLVQQFFVEKAGKLNVLLVFCW